MKNYLLTVLLFCGMSVSAFAQNSKVNVLYLDGSTHEVQMSLVAKLEVLGDDVLLVAKDGSTIASHKVSDVDRINLTSSTATGVSSLKTKSAITIRSNGYEITADGMTNGKELLVFNADGMLVGKAVASNGKATLSASSLKAGVYVVKAEGQQLKMVVRH